MRAPAAIIALAMLDAVRDILGGQPQSDIRASSSHTIPDS